MRDFLSMVQSLTGVLVLVASPGDALDERAAVQSGVNDWNVRTGRRLGVALLPWLWERHGIPQMGGRPQSLINRQALNQADVVVAFFDSRLGTATGVDVSGTAEEISRAEQDGKPVHLYFSAEPLPRDADLGQVAALRDFRTKLSSTGLLGEATDTADLAGQVIRALEADIDQYGWSTSVPEVTPRSARLGWTHEYQQQEKGVDKRGRIQYRTLKNDLVVHNSGTVAAVDLKFEVSPVGSTSYHFDAPQEPVTVPPDSRLSWLLVPSPGLGNSDRNIQISARWREGDEERNGTWTISLSS
jgi:hypothetical protein